MQWAGWAPHRPAKALAGTLSIRLTPNDQIPLYAIIMSLGEVLFAGHLCGG